MAIMVRPVNAAVTSYTVSDRLFVNTDVVGDTVYPAGGSLLTPQMLGMSEIHFISPAADAVSGVVAVYDYTTGKLKTFIAGVETPNRANQSGLTWRLLAIGKGFATLGS